MNHTFLKNKALKKPLAMLLSLAILTACILCVLGMSSGVSAHASVEETSSVVKVFIGDIMRAPEDYSDNRTKYIEELASTNPSEIITAVIGFDKYYAVNEINELVKRYDDIIVNRVYMWPEGETGRLSLYVNNGDISEGIYTYMKQVEENGLDNDPQSIEDYQRFLNGEYAIFAITISCSAETLYEAVQDNESILYADVKYNVEAEEYAKEKGKGIYYIELPSKPDGAA